MTFHDQVPVLVMPSTLCKAYHTRIQKVLPEGLWSQLMTETIDEGRGDPNTTKSGPTFKWHLAGRPMMFQH